MSTIPIESSQLPQRKEKGGCSRVFFFLFAVLLPALTLAIELTTHMCRESFFDPIPGPVQIVLIALVPLANFVVWRASSKEELTRLGRLHFLNGTALGTTLYFTLVFLPLSILAIPMTLYLGFGLLPLSPILSLVGALICLRLMRKRVPHRGLKLVGLGMMCTFGLLLLAELPSALTYHAMQGANQGDTDSLKRLRSWGAEDFVLECCYMRPESGLLLLGVPLRLKRADVDNLDSRKLYYRMTGVPFNSVPPPDFLRADLLRWNFDPEQGGEHVGGRLSSLFLEESSMVCSAQPNSALVYSEWTLVFRNDHLQESTEARTQILLPPGSVISRATLWVNGKEKEAAFATRAQARQAYEKVVRNLQDPLLVTTYGTDRALVQCFPVSPGGGKMRVRIGITSPLHLTSKTEGIFPMPKIAERNFNIEYPHQVKVISDSSLPNRGSMSLENGKASIENTDLSEPSSHLIFDRPSTDLLHSPAGNDRFVVAKIQPIDKSSPKTIFVVDGSASVGPFADQLTSFIPEDAKIIFGGDEVKELSLSELREEQYVGGQDGVSALKRALEVAGDREEIVWFNTSQPLELYSTDELRAQLKQRPDIKVLSFPLETGPNRVLEGLDGLDQLQTIVRSGTVKEDLARLLSDNKTWGLTFSNSSTAQGKPGSDHLTRLWAAQESKELWALGKEQEAAELAIKYQLVTPASGAVVLETQEQYEESDLEPVEAGTVPTIPEPEVWLLLLVGVGFLASRRKYRQA